MRAARLVADLQDRDVRMSVENNRLVVDAPKGVITPSLMDVLQRQKPEIIALLVATVDGWSREDWLAIYDERAGIAEYDGGVSRSEAEAQAYECCVSEWMNRNPSPSPPCCCAWCGETEDVGDCVVLPFGTEAHGHTWLHRRCWGDWFEMRRNRAMKALATLGILAPVSIPDEPRNLIAGGS